MFVDRLNPMQQGALLSIATQLMEADGNVAHQETELLNALRSQMTTDFSREHFSVNDLPEIFNSTSTKAAFLLELLGVAHADADYHASEKQFIKTVSAALSIPEARLADMESWVYKQFALVREAQQLMEE